MKITMDLTLSDRTVRAFAQVEGLETEKDIANYLRDRVSDEIEDVLIHYVPDEDVDEVTVDVVAEGPAPAKEPS